MYEISGPDEGGYRMIRREPGQVDKGSTFISMKGDLAGGLQSIREVKRKEFVGRLKASVSLGTSLYFEIKDEDRNIVSEPVEDIEELTSESETKAE
jgi:hypothetical protein